MNALIHPQLPLGFEPGELFTFDSFVAGSNTVATGLARQTALGEGENQLYFWGESGLGKSHLLQACCNLAAKNQQTVCYLTQAEIANQSADMFDGLEQLELICLDDIEDHGGMAAATNDKQPLAARWQIGQRDGRLCAVMRLERGVRL